MIPNFLLIGAAKSGTTSLYHYLKQHPQIFMSPIKEPKYFALQGQPFHYYGPGDHTIKAGTITRFDAYQALFDGVTNEIAVGEGSTIYLNHAQTAFNIHALRPDIKLIVVLRHPADRAFSAYMHLRRDGWETETDFAKALRLEPLRIQQGYYYRWHYQARGYYYHQLKPYFDIFPREQIKLFLYEEYTQNAHVILREIFSFLQVDPTFKPDVTTHHNQSGIPRNQQVQNFLVRSHPVKEFVKKFVPEQAGHRLISAFQKRTIERATLQTDIRRTLIDRYREDIVALQTLIDQDLSDWLK